MGNGTIGFVRRCLFVAAVALLIPIAASYGESIRQEVQQDKLKEVAHELSEGTASQLREETTKEKKMERVIGAQQTDTMNSADHGINADCEPVMLDGYAALYEVNSDFAGWLSIEGMKIDYPVMQCEDDEYYLYHDFYKEDSRYGSLYVRNRANLDSGTNFIIYGHNMKDGAMFGELDLYLQHDFYAGHKRISFNTLYEERSYDIIAVFRSQVYGTDEDVFKYYQFYEADTAEEFEDFYTHIKELSLYDTGVEAQFGDTFLTLSTCAYHVPYGRLVIVAKRV